MVENVCSGVDEVVWYSWHWTIVSGKWVSSAIVGCGGGVSHIVRHKLAPESDVRLESHVSFEWRGEEVYWMCLIQCLAISLAV